MRLAVVLALLIGIAPAGCVELGVVTDGTSVSVGRPSRGRIVDPARMPERGEGFLTREVWKSRGNRYGTDELVDLLIGVSGRVLQANGGVRLVVADLSGRGGGAARQWHRSHQNGRDVDLLYYMKDATGKPFENDAMHVVGPDLVAKDGSGHTVDVPRMWNLVKALLTAPEAPVQWIFVYQPVANAMIEHAVQIGEPEVIVERARKACKQPGDSAPHNDHIHVRVYCSYQDRAAGCIDIGPMEMLAEREAEQMQQQQQIASALDVRPPTFTEAVHAQLPASASASSASAPSASVPSASAPSASTRAASAPSTSPSALAAPRASASASSTSPSALAAPRASASASSTSPSALAVPRAAASALAAPTAAASGTASSGATSSGRASSGATSSGAPSTAPPTAPSAAMPAMPAMPAQPPALPIRRLLRTGAYRVDLWRWR